VREHTCVPTTGGRLPGAHYAFAMASHRYVVADVFTDTPLAGNPLAVFTDARAIDERTMAALAREMCFSETVFARCPA
jgi:trans-2,3-dihydro-3-hydroxyanthranilate isomerase